MTLRDGTYAGDDDGALDPLDLELYLLDATGDVLTGIGLYDRLEYTLRLGDVGTLDLTLTGDATDQVLEHLGPGLRVRVLLGDRVDFEGPLTGWRGDGGGDDPETWRLRAMTYHALMLRRPVRPSDYAPPATPGTYLRLSDPAGIAMKALVRRAFDLPPGAYGPARGPWAHPSLRVQQDRAPDQEGGWVRADLRFNDVLDMLGRIGAAGGVDWDIVPLGDGRFEFRTFAPYRGVDRRAENTAGNEPVIFSPDWGSHSAWSYELDASGIENLMIVAGQGELASRGVAEVQDAESVTAWGVWPAFVDARHLENDSDAAAKLRAEGVAHLAERAQPAESLEFDADAGAYVYGLDYGIGDLVTCDLPLPGLREFDQQITEVRVTVGAGATVQVAPTVGAAPLWRSTRRARDLRRRWTRVATR